MEWTSLAVALVVAEAACTGGGPRKISLGDAERTAVLAAISQELQALAAEPADAVGDDLVAFLAARPEIADARKQPGGNVTAHFVDGRWLIFYRNLLAGAATSAKPAAVAPPGPTPARTSGLPASKQARVMTTLVHFWDQPGLSGGPDAAPDIVDMLNARGYAATSPEPTLDNLRGMSGDGVFYFHTHGGTIEYFDGTESYSLLTASKVDASREQDGDLAFELANGLVGYAYTVFDAEVNADLGFDLFDPYYAISADFVSLNWSFAPNAFVFINACESADTGAPLRAALKASAVALWAGDANNQATNDAARYLFDRMLGANHFRAETPKQRPFDWNALLPDLARQGLAHTSTPDPKTGGVAVGDFVMVTLAAPDPAEGGFGLLAPSIEGLGAVDEHFLKLRIGGIFGNRPGAVTMGATPRDVESWTPSEIVVDLPSDSGDIDGNVVVTVDGVESNAVPLTSWTGHYRYVDDPRGLEPFEFRVLRRRPPDPGELFDA